MGQIHKSKPASETKIIFLIGAVQFVNIVDFMMVMPMGPDYAPALGIATSKLGLVGGSYGAAASIAGILGSFFLDKFDRRKALFVGMLGLGVGTIMGGFATGLGSLILARVIAGCFGGPASSLSFSIIADSIPPARRGKAYGAVMGAFSVASVLGVPAGLELSRMGGWRLPFFVVGATCLLITLSALSFMPPMISHLKAVQDAKLKKGFSLWRRPEVFLSYLASAAGMFSSFLLIPNFSTYFQHNLGFPREKLGLLYMFGGTLSFFIMRLIGRMIDLTSNTLVSILACGMVSTTLYLGYAMTPPPLSVTVIFAMTMLGFASRNVSVNSLSSRIPEPAERARFLSIQSSVNHVSCAIGAFISTQILRTATNGALIGVSKLAKTALIITLIIPILLWQVESRVRNREKSRP